MSENPRVIAARYICIVNGKVRPKGKTHYWFVSEKMKDLALKKGDVVRVKDNDNVPLVVIEEVLFEVPDEKPEQEMQTIKLVTVTPGMTWPYKKPSPPQEIKLPEKPDTNDLRTFSNRLRFALQYKKTGFEKFSDTMGAGKQYIRHCADGKQIPAPKKIRKMARLLEVPPEWLAGEPDKPLSFGDKLRQALTEEKISKGKFANEIKIPPEKIFKYITGEEFPTMDELRRIAKYLRVTPQWLAGNQ